MKVKWLLGLLGLACCLVVSARDGVRMLAPFGDELHFSDENILSGDVNGDGRVDMVDVVLTIRHLTGASSEEFPERAADVNMDGFLTAADIPLIVNIILRGGCPDAHHPHMIDLGLPSGTKWACCNMGAMSPETSGRYYSWGMCYENNPYLYNWDMYPSGDYNDKGDDKDYSQMVDIGSDIAGTDYDVALRTWANPGECLRWTNVANSSITPPPYGFSRMASMAAGLPVATAAPFSYQLPATAFTLT